MTGTIGATGIAERTGDPATIGPDDSGGGGFERRISQVPYLPGLDGMRALAVIAVMIYHANSDWLAGGYLGVEVFFVISGYLITLLLIAEHERTGTVNLGSFWVRRFRRLLPALFAMMLLLSVWVALFDRDQLGKLRGDVIAGASYFSNWYQIWIGAGYSAGNDFAPLRHLWSLAVEEQFYVVWPLVMVVLLRVGSRRVADVARWLLVGAIVLTVVTALLDHTAPQQNAELTPDAYWSVFGREISKPDALYLSTITRATGLMLGAAFAMIWRPAAVMRGPLRHRAKLLDAAAGVGLGILVVLSWTVSFRPSEGVHGFLFKGGFLLTGLATLAIIAAVTHRRSRSGLLLANPVLLWIGTRSYGLYLYHWPIYQIIRNIAANKLAFHEFVLAMVATAIITEASYRYVETPIRQGRISELWRRRGQVIPTRRSMTEGQRRGALAAVAVGVLLTVYAGASMATAELQQNEVEQSIAEGEQFTCDVLVEDCDDVGAGPDDSTVGDDTGGTDDAGPDTTDDEAVADETGDGSAATTTSEATTTSTTLPPASDMLALGDSVMLGAARELSELGFAVSAIESRSWSDGLEYMQTLADNDRLPRQTLVIHLGTNSAIGEDGMNAMMQLVADVPQVVVLTTKIPEYPDVEAENNALIYAVGGGQYPNVEYLDWGGLSNDCPGDCFAADGIHLRDDGRDYYSDVIQFQINN